MQKTDTILVTGAAGFIGSYVLGYLNKKGFENIIIADDFSRNDKSPNYESKNYLMKIERDLLKDWLKINDSTVDYVIHLGARTDTTEFDYRIHERLNVEYSKMIWEYCAGQQVPLIYASSAATYGDGDLGYKDDHALVGRLHPLNAYGLSKNEFDKWALKQESSPPFWAGLKFFNVYGPNEYHKGRMASVIFHSFNQIQKNGTVKLFRSHKAGFQNGEQLRDFIYVADVANVIYWMMEQVSAASHPPALASGLYNLGTGKARTFNDLVKATFAGLGMKPSIEYVDMPLDIRDKYQYFTEADMRKLVAAGYHEPFYSLEAGVEDYVKNYLSPHSYY